MTTNENIKEVQRRVEMLGRCIDIEGKSADEAQRQNLSVRMKNSSTPHNVFR